MKRIHLAVLIGTAALVACSDRQDPTQPSFPPGSNPPAVRMDLTGTIIPNPTRELRPAPFVLLESDGTMVGLAGDQTALLASVINAGVDVRGLIDDSGALVVDSFLVMAVQGAPAFDGVLEFNDSTYALHLNADGRRQDVPDPPEELKALVGQRVWITGLDADSVAAFGAITDATKASIASRRRR